MLATRTGKAFIRVVHADSPRSLAARVLLNRERRGGFVETTLDRHLVSTQLGTADRALCQELVFGCVRWQRALDCLIAEKTQGRTQKPVLQVLLRMGLYQLFWLDRIPTHAAVNESVTLARRLGCGPQSGFVNAVLRGYAREADATAAKLAALKRDRPAAGWSHPDWLVDRWTSRLGADQTQALLEWNNTPARTFARANTLKGDAGKLLELWREENVDYDFVRRDWLPDNLVFQLKSHPPLATLTSFREGWFYVQDPSTLLAVELLDPQPGDSVLDVCAAPGGKTTYIAQRMRNEGRIVATDTSGIRLERLKDNCSRLGVTCVESRVIKSAPKKPPPEENGSVGETPAASYDGVILDAPCSNTGVMRRRVDLRWRIKPDEIERLAGLQAELIRTAASQVKPGGNLVYSTCSLEPEENTQLIDSFLKENAEFELQDQREVTPWSDGVDGAFVAKLQRLNAATTSP